MKINIKKINILFMIMLIFCMFNYKNSDYEGYKFIYNNLNSPEIILEKGYVLVLKIIRYFTENYQAVVIIVGFFTLSFLSLTVKKMGNYQKFIKLYFIFPFFLDIIQIRFFLAYTIFLISISYYFEKKRIVLFILFLVSIFI
ncbi:EpsG family protein, partial [Cetobacterium sp.]|uniref:EpsG family protein n=1 Tax=Cetobacterium sp. TaxID=2071632 RepID=UPI003EE66DE3